MSKHPLDHDHKTKTDARAEAFTEIERRTGPEGDHPAVKALSKRPRSNSGTRVEKYARIDHGERS